MHAGSSEDQIHSTPATEDFPVVRISREELRSLTKAEVELADKTAQRKEMKSIFRNLVGKTLSDVFTTGYSAVTDGVKNSPFFLAKTIVIKIIHRKVLKVNSTIN